MNERVKAESNSNFLSFEKVTSSLSKANPTERDLLSGERFSGKNYDAIPAAASKLPSTFEKTFTNNQGYRSRTEYKKVLYGVEKQFLPYSMLEPRKIKRKRSGSDGNQDYDSMDVYSLKVDVPYLSSNMISGIDQEFLCVDIGSLNKEDTVLTYQKIQNKADSQTQIARNLDYEVYIQDFDSALWNSSKEANRIYGDRGFKQSYYSVKKINRVKSKDVKAQVDSTTENSKMKPGMVTENHTASSIDKEEFNLSNRTLFARSGEFITLKSSGLCVNIKTDFRNRRLVSYKSKNSNYIMRVDSSLVTKIPSFSDNKESSSLGDEMGNTVWIPRIRSRLVSDYLDTIEDCGYQSKKRIKLETSSCSVLSCLEKEYSNFDPNAKIIKLNQAETLTREVSPLVRPKKIVRSFYKNSYSSLMNDDEYGYTNKEELNGKAEEVLRRKRSSSQDAYTGNSTNCDSHLTGYDYGTIAEQDALHTRFDVYEFMMKDCVSNRSRLDQKINEENGSYKNDMQEKAERGKFGEDSPFHNKRMSFQSSASSSASSTNPVQIQSGITSVSPRSKHCSCSVLRRGSHKITNDRHRKTVKIKLGRGYGRTFHASLDGSYEHSFQGTSRTSYSSDEPDTFGFKASHNRKRKSMDILPSLKEYFVEPPFKKRKLFHTLSEESYTSGENFTSFPYSSTRQQDMQYMSPQADSLEYTQGRGGQSAQSVTHGKSFSNRDQARVKNSTHLECQLFCLNMDNGKNSNALDPTFDFNFVNKEEGMKISVGHMDNIATHNNKSPLDFTTYQTEEFPNLRRWKSNEVNQDSEALEKCYRSGGVKRKCDGPNLLQDSPSKRIIFTEDSRHTSLPESSENFELPDKFSEFSFNNCFHRPPDPDPGSNSLVLRPMPIDFNLVSSPANFSIKAFTSASSEWVSVVVPEQPQKYD